MNQKWFVLPVLALAVSRVRKLGKIHPRTSAGKESSHGANRNRGL
jgi:hypothetical protein